MKRIVIGTIFYSDEYVSYSGKGLKKIEVVDIKKGKRNPYICADYETKELIFKATGKYINDFILKYPSVSQVKFKIKKQFGKDTETEYQYIEVEE